MVKIAQTESSLNPNAAHPQSSARGLYQFMTAPGGSWQEYGRGGNPLDPAANADAGMRYTKDNIAHLKSAIGRDPSPGEVYLAHQQGRAGAAALLSNPSAPAVDVIRKFYRNPETARSAITLNGGTPDMTAAQFAAKWTGRFDGGQSPAGTGQPQQTSNPEMQAMQALMAVPAQQQGSSPSVNPMLALASAFGSLSPPPMKLQPAQPPPIRQVDLSRLRAALQQAPSLGPFSLRV